MFWRKRRPEPTPSHPVLLTELTVNGKTDQLGVFYAHAQNIARDEWSTTAEQGLAMTVVALVDKMIEGADR